MWLVNMTDKTKGWPVNSPIIPDIVCWPAMISSPALGFDLHTQKLEPPYTA